MELTKTNNQLVMRLLYPAKFRKLRSSKTKFEFMGVLLWTLSLARNTSTGRRRQCPQLIRISGWSLFQPIVRLG